MINGKSDYSVKKSTYVDTNVEIYPPREYVKEFLLRFTSNTKDTVRGKPQEPTNFSMMLLPSELKEFGEYLIELANKYERGETIGESPKPEDPLWPYSTENRR